jgi:hypothetical protein
VCKEFSPKHSPTRSVTGGWREGGGVGFVEGRGAKVGSPPIVAELAVGEGEGFLTTLPLQTTDRIVRLNCTIVEFVHRVRGGGGGRRSYQYKGLVQCSQQIQSHLRANTVQSTISTAV